MFFSFWIKFPRLIFLNVQLELDTHIFLKNDKNNWNINYFKIRKIWIILFIQNFHIKSLILIKFKQLLKWLDKNNFVYIYYSILNHLSKFSFVWKVNFLSIYYTFCNILVTRFFCEDLAIKLKMTIWHFIILIPIHAHEF